MRYRRFLSACGIALLGLAADARAVSFDDPTRYHVKNEWSGVSLGIPGPLGGLLFSEDGAVLYVVGESEGAGSALYAVPVARDAATHEVTALGPAAAVTPVFSGTKEGLDAGWERPLVRPPATCW